MVKTIPITRDLSARLANMSFVCACMIVLFHATPAPESGTWMWWMCRIFGREGICSMAVPFFFMASGFFVAGHLGVGEWCGEIRKRIRSVIIPFYSWLYILTAFAFAIWYLKSHTFGLAAKGNPLGLPMSELILKLTGLHPFEDIGVLWYLRALFLFVVALPVFGWLSRHWRWSLTMLFIVYCSFEILYAQGAGWKFYFFFDRIVSIRGTFYFLAGVVLRSCFRGRLESIRGRAGFWLLAAAILGFAVAAGLAIEGLGGVACLVRVGMVPIAILGMFVIMPVSDLPPCFRGAAFPMYLMHNMFLSISSLMLVALGLRDLQGVGMFCVLLFRTVFSIFGSLLAICVMRRVFPRSSLVLFGGR